MSDVCQKGYFLDKNGKLHYAESVYDGDGFDYDDFCDGLQVYSNDRDHRSCGDGEHFKSVEQLFSGFVNDGQFNVKKLAEKLNVTVDDYCEYDWAAEDIKERVENGETVTINDISDDELKEYFAERYPDICMIPAFVFTDRELLAENFPYYSTGIRMRNYSCAGPTFWDSGYDSEDQEPDAVMWIDRETFEKSWGTAEENRFEQLENTIKTFQDWANGNVFGLRWRDWDEEKDCWTEEDSVWGFVGEDYYDLEILLVEEYEPTVTEGVRRPIVKTFESLDKMSGMLDHLPKKPFSVEMNDGVLLARERDS